MKCIATICFLLFLYKPSLAQDTVCYEYASIRYLVDSAEIPVIHNRKVQLKSHRLVEQQSYIDINACLKDYINTPYDSTKISLEKNYHPKCHAPRVISSPTGYDAEVYRARMIRTGYWLVLVTLSKEDHILFALLEFEAGHVMPERFCYSILYKD